MSFFGNPFERKKNQDSNKKLKNSNKIDYINENKNKNKNNNNNNNNTNNEKKKENTKTKKEKEQKWEEETPANLRRASFSFEAPKIFQSESIQESRNKSSTFLNLTTDSISKNSIRSRGEDDLIHMKRKTNSLNSASEDSSDSTSLPTLSTSLYLTQNENESFLKTQNQTGSLLFSPQHLRPYSETDIKGIAEGLYVTIPTKDRIYIFKTYRDCWIANDAIKWLCNNVENCNSEKQAIKIGNIIRDLGYFQHVVDPQKKFQKGYFFFFWTSKVTSRKSQPIENETVENFENLISLVFKGKISSSDFLFTFRTYGSSEMLFSFWRKEFEKENSEELFDFLRLWIDKYYHLDFLGKAIEKQFFEMVESLPVRKKRSIKTQLAKRKTTTKNIWDYRSSLNLEKEFSNSSSLNSDSLNLKKNISIFSSLNSDSLNSKKNISISSSLNSDSLNSSSPNRRDSSEKKKLELSEIDNIEENFQRITIPLTPRSPPLKSPTHNQKITHQSSFLKFKNSDLVTGLTHIETSLFTFICPTELLSQNWLSSQKAHLSPNIYQLTEHFNTIAFWVVNEILFASEKEKGPILKKFISLSHTCKELGNFNSMMEIYAGLSHYLIKSQKYLWKGVTTNSQNKFNSIEELMNPVGNYQNYRKELKSRSTVFPYFPLFLTDLVFLFEANQPFTEANQPFTEVNPPPKNQNKNIQKQNKTKKQILEEQKLINLKYISISGMKLQEMEEYQTSCLKLREKCKIEILKYIRSISPIFNEEEIEKEMKDRV